MGVTVDSTFVVNVIRGDPGALSKGAEIDERGEARFVSTPVLYEVTTGILFRESRQDAESFARLAARFALLPFDASSARKAAEIQTDLLRAGRPKSHTDVMIAAIAVTGGHSLVTRDRGFRDIASVVELSLESY